MEEQPKPSEAAPLENLKKVLSEAESMAQEPIPTTAETVSKEKMIPLEKVKEVLSILEQHPDETVEIGDIITLFRDFIDPAIVDSNSFNIKEIESKIEEKKTVFSSASVKELAIEISKHSKG